MNNKSALHLRGLLLIIFFAGSSILNATLSLALDKSTVEENQSSGTVVGNFSLTFDKVIDPNTIGTKKWEFPSAGSAGIPAIGPDGTVFVQLDNKVLALESESGVKKWEYGSSVRAGKLSICEQGHVYFSSGSKIIALDGGSGETIWETDAGTTNAVLMGVGNERVYVGEYKRDEDNIYGWGRRTMYSLSKISGSKNRGYSYDKGAGSSLGEFVLGEDGHYYIGSSLHNWVYAVKDSEEQWEYKAFSDPRIESMIYGGNGEIILGNKYEEIFTLDVLTGRRKVSFDTNKGIRSLSVGGDGVVYLGSTDNSIYSVSLDPGVINWGYATGDVVNTPVVGSDGTIYIGSGHVIHAINSNDGTRRWTYDTGGSVSEISLTTNGTIIVGADGVGVVALQGSSGPDQSPWPMSGQNVRRTFSTFPLYSLVPGEGDSDNPLFEIDGSVLRTAGSFNYEERSQYTIRVKGWDTGGMVIERSLLINVKDVNERPTDVFISNTPILINEGAPVGTELGRLTVLDPDEQDTHTFYLSSSPHNDAFVIEGNVIKTAVVLPKIDESIYTLHIYAYDAGGLRTPNRREYNVSIVMEQNPPTGITLTGSSFSREIAKDDVVGTFNLLDIDIQKSFLSNISKVDQSGYYSSTVFLKKDGSTWINPDGSSGKPPKQLIESGVVDVQAGHDFYYFLSNDGSLHAMGNNSRRQLGDGTTKSKDTPIQVLDSDVVQISAGYNHGLFIKSDGSLWGMGYNGQGQLGVGGTQTPTSPIQIIDSEVVQSSAGQGYTMFVREDGSLWGMGDNSEGQLGNGKSGGYGNFDDGIDTMNPVEIIPSNVKYVSASDGYFPHTLFIKTDGSLWGMGSNRYGQLGTNLPERVTTPVKLIESGVKNVDASGYYGQTLILMEDGSAWAMGDNRYGQMGNGTVEWQHSKMYDKYGLSKLIEGGVSQVSAGFLSNLFVMEDGTLWGTGSVETWNLTNLGKSKIIYEEPQKLDIHRVTDVSLSKQNNSKTSQTTLFRFGGGTSTNGDGALYLSGYDGYNLLHAKPVEIFDADINTMAAGDNFNLVVKYDGSLWSWGDNYYGQLGDGTKEDRQFPVQIFDSGVKDVAAGSNHSLILKEDGTVWSMGINRSGTLGDATTTDSLIPKQAIISNVDSIAAGPSISFAINENGSLWYWGGGKARPTQLVSSGVTKVSGGYTMSLILKENGSVWQWKHTEPSPVQVIGSGGIDISAGELEYYLVKQDGSLWEWKHNTTPEMIVASDVVSIFAGDSRVLFLKRDGTLWGFGSNFSGHMGNGWVSGDSVWIVTMPFHPVISGFSFELVNGTGDSGNQFFYVKEGRHLVYNSPSTSHQDTYSIRVKGTDNTGLSIEQVFTLEVLQKDIPRFISLDNSTVPSSAQAGSTVGNLEAYNEGTHIFSLPASSQYPDNTKFRISGNSLQVGAVLEANTEYTLILQATSLTGITYTQELKVLATDPSKGYKPVILTSPRDAIANMGMEATFWVEADASNSTFVEFQWYFGSKPLQDGNGISGSTSNTLLLSNVSGESHGNYYCIISNRIGETRTRTVKLTVLEEPYSPTGLADQTLSQGEILALLPVVKGSGPFIYRWFKDGNLIEGATKNTLYVGYARPSDSGRYTFDAIGSAGILTLSSTVTVNGATPGTVLQGVDTDTPAHDADGDSLNNLLEYAMGSDPANPGSTHLPVLYLVEDGDGNPTISFHYTESHSATDVTILVEQSTNLQSWDPIDLNEVDLQRTDRGEYTGVSVYIPMTSEPRFLRVRVEKR